MRLRSSFLALLRLSFVPSLIERSQTVLHPEFDHVDLVAIFKDNHRRKWPKLDNIGIFVLAASSPPSRRDIKSSFKTGTFH